MDKIKTFLLLAKYNFKVIFGGKFIWFLLVATLFFIFLMFNLAYEGVAPSEERIYPLMLFPGLLLLFYPTVYGLQNDEENKILEILFGIPNYMYKVWLVRLAFVYVECFALLIAMGLLASVLLCPVSIFDMAFQVMFPVTFFGSLAFLLSTSVKGGNATAVIVIIIAVVLNIVGSDWSLRYTTWNIWINPFAEPTWIHTKVYQDALLKSRLILSVCSFLFILVSLMNLQRREKLL